MKKIAKFLLVFSLILLSSMRLRTNVFAEEADFRVFEEVGQISYEEVLVPMTEKEIEELNRSSDFIQARAQGSNSKSPGGNFTLYTIASFSGTNIVASSVGQYATYGLKPASEAPVEGHYDYISIAMPTQYTVTSPQLKGLNYGSYRANETNNAIAYGVMLRGPISAPGQKSATLSAVGIKNSDINSKKIISGYTHNYSAVKLGISFSATGASFSVSPSSKTWTIYSSVII